MFSSTVIPAKAGIHEETSTLEKVSWMLACASMTAGMKNLCLLSASPA
jgi:hypothetical protein